MTYAEGLKEISRYQHLIGKCIDGAIIDELILIPTDSKLQEQFTKSYINCLNAELAIFPFQDENLEILVVFDKQRMRKEDLFLHMSLNELKNRINNG